MSAKAHDPDADRATNPSPDSAGRDQQTTMTLARWMTRESPRAELQSLEFDAGFTFRAVNDG